MNKELRPLHLRWRYLLLVAGGGTIGTALRAGLGLLFPPVAGFPFTTMAINLVGAFALGLLLEGLTLSRGDPGRTRAIRLCVGTGVLGGFTTYSALANDTVALLRNSPTAGITYALGTVVLGGIATLAGIVVAQRFADRKRP